MSEPQQPQKKNKKKKKHSKNENVVADQVPKETVNKPNETKELDSTITEILPQQVGITKKFKDVEVTMTNNGNEATNGTSKKKKKKKKGKQQTNEETEKTADAENQNLLNFTENRIELVNHPEISVTISTASVVQPEEPAKPKEKCESVPEKSAPSGDAVTSTSTKKKKKKKKKKNPENDTAEPPDNAKPEDDAQSTPTYVKLPADGGNCVLLVSHESFSNGNKQATSNTNSDTQSKSATVLIKNKEICKSDNMPSTNPNDQNSDSVSIFPVYSDSNKKPEKSSEFNVSSSLNKINDRMKNESEGSPNIGDTSNPSDALHSEENKPTKAQLKAERRAKQEAQRAAKLAKNSEKNPQPSTTEQEKKSLNLSKEQIVTKQSSPTNEDTSIRDISKVSVEQEVLKKVNIFSHLSQRRDLLTNQIANIKGKIPPPIIELGSHYSKGTLCGSNARCVGFLGALRQVIMEYKTPKNKIFSKDLDSKLQSYLDFLNNCRPLSVSIVNSMKFLKHHLNHIPDNMEEGKAKEDLCMTINNYVREEILLAKEAIALSASIKIVNNDTILVFAYSSLVKEVLCKALDQKKYFRVIVVDSRAKLEGLEMLRQLTKHGIHCCYISINAVSTIIKKVNKVIIGAHALLANGYVMSRLGCKILSLLGSTSNVPVLVCCETYKFWERSLTDSIVHNELGNPDDLATTNFGRKDNLLKWHKLSSLQVYNLLYDVTPSELVSVVITEKGLVPCTSVPVILRVKHAGLQE